MRFPSAYPEIPVRELGPALDYYRNQLGFTIDWSDEELGLAGLSQGASRLFIGAARYRAHLETGGGKVVIWLSLSSRAEVDALYDRWRIAGAKLDLPPAANEPYSLYEFLAFDPDGNILRVYHFMVGVESA